MGWFGSIFTARESETEEETLKEEDDGNYKYEKSGTYGQSDYTVRPRNDGTYDLYVKSDSERGHSHDHIDEDGNLLDRYHDYVYSKLKKLSYEELQYIEKTTDNEYIKYSARVILMRKSTLENEFSKKLTL